MQLSSNEAFIAIITSVLSGFATAMYSQIKSKKAYRIRETERAQDHLRIELKDLQIKLYQLEKDLDEWKDKYYEAIQELIAVKSELEATLIRLTHAELHLED